MARAMLADDVRLDLVSHWKRAGRKDVSSTTRTTIGCLLGTWWRAG